jgi:hypothetical protein
MATRVKTIEYATTTTITTLAAATNRDLTSPTSIYIPETPTFKSVVLYVDCTNDISSTSAASLTAPIISITLGAAAISTLTLSNPLANSGEKEVWQFSRDVTSYFTTNWTGTGMTWSVRVNFTGMATANHSAKVIITYEYDDTAAKQIKTIRIPIESTRTQLTTSWQTVGGTTAIPAIKNFGASPYLPETGITIRQIFLEMWGNAGTASTTDFTWQTRIAGGTAIDTYRHEAALNSATWTHVILDITTQTLTSESSLECISIGITNRLCTIGGMIVVTYEFNPTTSTTIYNSLMIGAVDTQGWIGGTTEADGGVWERTIYIEEPDTITLKESALCLFQNDSGTYTFNVRVSGNTAEQTTIQAYVNTAGGIQCGTYSLVHRIDAGGQKGQSGVSLKRGRNLYRVIFYSGTAQAGWNLSGFLILNYTSSKHTSGVGAHTHSVYQHVTDNITAAGSRVNTSDTITPSLPETYYNLIGFLYWVNYNIGASTDNNFVIDAEVASTDVLQGGNGWQSLYQGTTRSDNENMNGWIYAAARTNFTRWNGDPDPDRLNIKTGRKYRLSNGALWTGSMGYWYTYNTITYTVSGTCAGFSGDGSGIGVDIFRKNTTIQDDLILNLTTTTGGIFTGQWVDNTDTLYAAARQDDTHVGRSADGTAT